MNGKIDGYGGTLTYFGIDGQLVTETTFANQNATVRYWDASHLHPDTIEAIRQSDAGEVESFDTAEELWESLNRNEGLPD